MDGWMDSIMVTMVNLMMHVKTLVQYGTHDSGNHKTHQCV